MDDEALYKEVGRRIRETRERPGRKLSQEKLAKRLKISRASVVNIEAGRQHAPLNVLWHIAEVLETDLVLLIPRRDELLSSDAGTPLDKETLEQIRVAAKGDSNTEKILAGLVSKLKTTIEAKNSSKEVV